MHFSTLIAAAITLVSAASAVAIEQPNAPVSKRDAHLEKFGLAKRGCPFSDCDTCFEKYLPCVLDDPFSGINWYVNRARDLLESFLF